MATIGIPADTWGLLGATPEAASKAAKGNSAKLREYWTGGATSALEQEGRVSLLQLHDMLDTLFAVDRGDGKTPDGWKDLKGIREFEASGRAHCRGLPCFRTRVFTDQGEHIWLVSEDYRRDYRRTLISLDNNAALHTGSRPNDSSARMSWDDPARGGITWQQTGKIPIDQECRKRCVRC